MLQRGRVNTMLQWKSNSIASVDLRIIEKMIAQIPLRIEFNKIYTKGQNRELLV